MAVQAVPVVSEPIYLGDISKRVRALEGDCERTDQAYVIVRQATTGDNMRRSQIHKGTTLRWLTDEDGKPVTEENYNQNPLERYAFEAYTTLAGIGNLFDTDGKPMFEFESSGSYMKVKGDFNDFKERWGRLPLVVTDAILTAVYSTNPDWDWRVRAPLLPPEMGTEGEA
jgi:hypothetical protein